MKITAEEITKALDHIEHARFYLREALRVQKKVHGDVREVRMYLKMAAEQQKKGTELLEGMLP